MQNFKKLNNIVGWVAFAIALVVYLITMEKTGSLWDCGEFLSCTYKLQVAHPPGAPFFMMVGKMLSLLSFGDTHKIAMFINSISAISTAFCTLFFFWSSTMLLRSVFVKNGEITQTTGTLILGASFLGAMAATFLDSMWFNAIEGEVYAFSVSFMAFNVWAILKWRESDSPNRDKWLLLAALLTGMSVGVHLLSLLAFPMMGLVIYLDKFKFSWLGMAIAFAASIVMIFFTMSFMLISTSNFLGELDIFFVNTLGLPFYVGSILGIFLIIALFAFLIRKSAENGSFLRWNEKKFKFPLNTVVLFFAFLYIGYTSYFMVVIRANANTPINMNVPDNFKTLKSYIAREQYGDRPLGRGPFYPDLGEIVDMQDVGAMYDKSKTKDGKDIYVNTGENKKYIYSPAVLRWFPRLGHEGDDKKNFYRLWLNPSYDVVDRATNSVVQNFPAGQSDQAEQQAAQMNQTAQPGQFVVKDHLTAWDNLKYFINYQCGFMYFRYMLWNFSGRTDDLQGHGFNDKGRWIAGINVIDNLVGTLFGNPNFDQAGKPALLTSNRAHNVFYMIPLLLCLLGMYYSYTQDRKTFAILMFLFLATGLMQIVQANQPPIEPRERDYVFAPSFWAFAFWLPFGAFYLYSLLQKSLKGSAVYVALAITAVAPLLMGAQGWDDHNRNVRTSTLAFAKDVLNSCPPNALLLCYGDNDTYPLWYAQELEGIRTDVRVVNTSLIEASSYISQLYLPMNKSNSFKITIPFDKLRGNQRGFMRFNPTALASDTFSLDEIIDFMTSDNQNTKVSFGGGISENFIPTTHAYLKIDRERAVKSGLVDAKDLANIPEKINIELPTTLYKGNMIQLHLLAQNFYDRPICFALHGSEAAKLGLGNYLKAVGMIYEFTPYAAPAAQGLDAMDMEKSYQIVKSFDFGRIKEHILLDENTYRSYLNIKQTIGNLARTYAVMGNTARAKELIQFYFQNIPTSILPLDNGDLSILDAAQLAGDAANKKMIEEGLYKNTTSVLDWLTNANNMKKLNMGSEELRLNMSVLNAVKEVAQRDNDQAMVQKVDAKMQGYQKKFQSSMGQ